MKLKQNHKIEVSGSNQKTTTGDQEKRYRFFQKLISHNPQSFRQIDIDEFDLNMTENFEELEYIDDVVTPLIYCAHHGNSYHNQGLKEICRHLLRNKKIDIDFQTENNKQTPLIVACMRGNYEIARLLALAGAEINKPNSLNQTPLASIIFRLAEEVPSFENNLICIKLAEFLLSHGADINWIIDKSRGYTMLHYFCSVKIKMNKGQVEINTNIIKFLLRNGADINQKTLKDETIQTLILKHCNKQMIEKLIQQTKQQQQSEKRKKKQNKVYTKVDANIFKLPSHSSKPSTETSVIRNQF